MILILYYLAGFIFTAIFLKLFGKKIGLDYNSPRTYVNQEDWAGNDEAYTAFSIFWFMILPIVCIFGIATLLKYLLTKIFKF